MQAEINDRVPYGILDSSCWYNRGQIGPSIAEEMISEGCRWRPSDRSAGARVADKNQLHELLGINEITEKPGIIFFNTCQRIIADLPAIPSDHAYDSVR